MQCIYELAIEKIDQRLKDDLETKTDYDSTKVAQLVKRGTYYNIKHKRCSVGVVINALRRLGSDIEFIVDGQKYK